MSAVEVRGLGVELDGAKLLDGLSLSIEAGALHALVGESGSGKTTAANALLRLLPEGAKVRGSALVGTVDLIALGAAALERARGRTVAMMLQEPLAALNPVLTVGAHLTETLEVHRAVTKGELRSRAVALLEEVGLPEPASRFHAYPHQLSGGQRQRVLLAAALACEPALLIADEPTTALDASMKGVVLALIRGLAERRKLAVLLISHDLWAVREVCRDVSVLYAGRLVEQGPVAQVFARPRHPYTHALLAARPAPEHRGGALEAIGGVVPGPNDVVPGCRFHPRCPRAEARCRIEVPALVDGCACHFPLGGEGRR
ncbi:MAG: ABC transporter ATP-binding protein [Myxococcales bacterium]|nr:ABC transporter ATP-binding protein [Myxococcales bacterium]